MENNYNDTDILIINSREYKYSPTIKLWYVISITLCVISYILLDINIMVSYDSLITNIGYQYLPDQYKYIYIYDYLYAAWYLGSYIYIACNNNKNIKCVYFLILIIYLANFVLHIFLYVIITNELKKYNMKMTDGTDNFIFYCISVIFNWIMTLLYLIYI